MISRNPCRRRRRVPVLDRLECRRLLTVSVVSDGQSGDADLTGPNASQGSDGIVDIHFSIMGLTTNIASVVIVSTGPTAYDNSTPEPPVGAFAWATAPNPDGYAMSEFFQTPGADPGRPLP